VKKIYLVGECETTHTGLDPEDVVVDGEHPLGSGVEDASLHRNLDLGVVNTREVAGSGGLVLLGLQCERIRVDTGVRVAGVVHEGLDLIEVLAGLLLEPVLTVEDELEAAERTARHVGNNGVGVSKTVLEPLAHGDIGAGTDKGSSGTTDHHGHTGGIPDGDESHDIGRPEVHASGGLENDGVGAHQVRSKVPETVEGAGTIVVAPHELLDGVVVGQTDLLLLGGRGSDSDRVRPGVLNLLDEVLVTLLGKAPALLRVEVHIVTPDVYAAGGVVKSELAGEVEIETDLVVLESDKGKVQPGVPVEEEDEGKVNLVGPASTTVGRASGGSRELGPVGLLVSGQVKLGVQPPPNLVVLVNALTTDGELNVLDGALGSPAPGEGTGRGDRPS